MSPLIGQGIAGRDINIVQTVGIGAIGIALIVAAVIAVTSFFSAPDVRINHGVVLAVAQDQGFVSPEEAILLAERVERAEDDLQQLRRTHPDWNAEIDAAVRAFNEGNLNAAIEAFARVDALIAASRADLRADEARSKYTQATLFHPFEYSKSALLLCDAANLAASEISYWIDCGYARMEVGHLEQALNAFQMALDLSQDGGQIPALDGIVGVYSAQRNVHTALQASQGMLDIARRHASQNPSNVGAALGLLRSLNIVGSVHYAKGDLDAALGAYQESLDTARAFAVSNPGPIGWNFHAAQSLVLIGDVRRAQGDLDAALQAYEEGLDRHRALANTFADNDGFAFGVLLNLNKVGNVRRTQGDLDAALLAFEESLAINRPIVARSPDSPGWARQLSVTLTNLGEVRREQGDLAAALEAYEESLNIVRTIADQDPANAVWARDVSISLWRIAMADQPNAAEHWAAVVAHMEDMEAKGTLLPADEPSLEAARQNLANAQQ